MIFCVRDSQFALYGSKLVCQVRIRLSTMFCILPREIQMVISSLKHNFLTDISVDMTNGLLSTRYKLRYSHRVEGEDSGVEEAVDLIRICGRYFQSLLHLMSTYPYCLSILCFR